MFRSIPLSFELAADFGTDQPTFHNCVKFAVEGRLPLPKFVLFSFEANGSTYWYGFQEQPLIVSEVHVCCQGNFDKKYFLLGFEQFDKAIGLSARGNSYYIVGNQCFNKSMPQYLESRGFSCSEYGCALFYVTKEQAEKLAQTETHPLPDGFAYGPATLEDAELITNLWKYSHKNELAQTRIKLEHLPSSCVKFQGKTVGFQMMNTCGFLNHLLVFEEHRGKGIGLLLELELMKKAVKEGIVAQKMVEPSNTRIIELSERSQFWTRLSDSDGTPLFASWLEVWPKGKMFGDSV